MREENKKAAREPDRRIRGLAACMRAKIGRKVTETVRRNTSLRFNTEKGELAPIFENFSEL